MLLFKHLAHIISTYIKLSCSTAEFLVKKQHYPLFFRDVFYQLENHDNNEALQMTEVIFPMLSKYLNIRMHNMINVKHILYSLNQFVFLHIVLILLCHSQCSWDCIFLHRSYVVQSHTFVFLSNFNTFFASNKVYVIIVLCCNSRLVSWLVTLNNVTYVTYNKALFKTLMGKKINGKNTSETKSSEEVDEHCCTLESKTVLRSPFDHSVFIVEQSFRFWRCCNSCTSTKLNVLG